MGRIYRLMWGGMRLLALPEQDHWAVTVYDTKQHRTLFRTERKNAPDAKVAAVAFALVHLYGPFHEFNPKPLSTVLPWSAGRA